MQKCTKSKSRTFTVVIFVRSESNKMDLKFLKRIGQSCNGIREKQRGGRAFSCRRQTEIRIPDAETIFIVFPKKYSLLSVILWSKFLLKTHSNCKKFADTPPRPGLGLATSLWRSVCDRAPDNGGLETEVKFPTLQRFYSFFPKNNAFLGIGYFGFCLKTLFLFTSKCVDVPPRPESKEYAAT